MTARRSLKLYALRLFFMTAAKPTVRLGLHYKDMYFTRAAKRCSYGEKTAACFPFFPGSGGRGKLSLDFRRKKWYYFRNGFSV